MSWRMKVANWISGGELRRVHNESADNFMKCLTMMGALVQIADQEKPTSNATVRRMARIANEALGRG